MQSSWEFYSNIREHIAYIHIKDGFVDDDGKEHRSRLLDAGRERFSEGIIHVLVDGEPALESGETTGWADGQFLRRAVRYQPD